MSRRKPNKLLMEMFSRKLKELMTLHELSSAPDLVRFLEEKAQFKITAQAARDYLDGKVLPASDALLAFSESFRRSMEWFLGGSEPHPTLQATVCPNIILLGELKEKPDVKLENYYAVPLVSGSVAAGEGREISEDEIKSLVWIYAPELKDRANHNFISVQVDRRDGESMMPTLYPGDIVLIDKDDPKGDEKVFKDGGLYAIRASRRGGTSVKRIYKSEDAFIISSDNRDFPPKTAWSGNLSELIIGRVIWGWRNLLKV